MSEEKKTKAIRSIMKNYCQVEKSIVEQLNMKQDLHGTTIGSMREDIWADLFQMLIPKKFVIEHSVFIIDSKGRVSNEVDLAIIDEMYTPYIFRYGRVKFIPIEAVAVVVECKSTSVKGVEDWADNIEKLHTAGETVTRLATGISKGPAPAQSSTRPIRILCKMGKEATAEIKEKFDFIIYAIEEESHLNIQRNTSYSDLWEWYMTLNHYQSKVNKDKLEQDKSKLEGIGLEQYEIFDQTGNINMLLTFNMQLNQLLMLINNPMFFPHQSYVNMFNQNGGKKVDG